LVTLAFAPVLPSTNRVRRLSHGVREINVVNVDIVDMQPVMLLNSAKPLHRLPHQLERQHTDLSHFLVAGCFRRRRMSLVAEKKNAEESVSLLRRSFAQQNFF